MNLQPPILLPYLTAGWPSEDGFLQAVRGAARAGCSAFEVGIPFSDPIADGPVIQKTSQEALDAGMTPERALRLTKRAVDETGLPAIAMTYVNLVHRDPHFLRKLVDHGVQGLILPDLPLEEADLVPADAGLDLVHLCAPTTPPERRRLLAEATRGFLYLVSVAGVTGARTELPADLEELIDDVKRHATVPVCVGFGISTPEQAARVAARADGVIVGSALLRHIEAHQADIEKAVADYLGSLRLAMEGVRA